uniref:Uncharacterized protein n=1 Tax=Octopus bimaculoides TaxID=37653 RepID=A0A0L8IEN1_OCTBM
MYKRESMLFIVLSVLLFLINPVDLTTVPSTKCTLKADACAIDKTCSIAWYNCQCSPYTIIDFDVFCLTSGLALGMVPSCCED